MEMAQLMAIYAKLSPLLLFVVLGFIVGRLKIERQSIINLTVFALMPITFFAIGFKTSANPLYIALPVLMFLLSTVVCFIYLKASGKIWDHKAKNLAAFASGSNGISYGLAMVVALFPAELVGVYAFASIGATIYQYTVGVYVVARGNYNVRNSLIQVLKLPLLHGFTLGILLKSFEVELPGAIMSFCDSIQTCFLTLGLVMLGMCASTITSFKIDWRFVAVLFSARFIASPLIALTVILIDVTFWQFYSLEIHFIMLLLASMPTSINTVIFANMYSNSCDEAAIATVLSTFVAAFFLPVMFYIGKLFGAI